MWVEEEQEPDQVSQPSETKKRKWCQLAEVKGLEVWGLGRQRSSPKVQHVRQGLWVVCSGSEFGSGFGYFYQSPVFGSRWFDTTVTCGSEVLLRCACVNIYRIDGAALSPNSR